MKVFVVAGLLLGFAVHGQTFAAAAGGSEASGMPPAETAQAARSLNERWGAIIRTTGVKLD